MSNFPIRKLLDIASGWRPRAISDFDSLSIVARRFLKAFADHGLEVSQIPRLLPQVTLDDLQSQVRLLAALTPEILDKAAQLFGIRVQWLEGVNDEIYDYQAVYKRPATLLEHLAKIRQGEAQGLEFPLRVLTTAKQPDRNDPSQQLLAPVLVERFADLGAQGVYRYHVYRDGFDWSHPPARIELKAIARVIFTTLHVPIPLFVVSEKDMDDILEGRTIPRRFLEGCQITSPSLEDYVLSLDDRYSLVAKEVDELPELLAYIDTHHLMDISLEGAKPPYPEAAAVPIETATPATPAGTPKPPSKPGKLQARDDAWAEVMGYAKGHWAEDPSISIAEMIRRIKKIKAMKASMLAESTIHKRIVKVAPVGIRGKSGRKANKSP